MIIIIAIITFIALSGLIVAILITTGAFDSKSDESTLRLSGKENKSPYINPTPFNTGYIKDIPPQQKLADLCNKVMYPVNPPYVDYGAPITSNCCGDCDVNIFNSPP